MWPIALGTNGIELYDLEIDIREENNLAADRPDVVDELMELELPNGHLERDQ